MTEFWHDWLCMLSPIGIFRVIDLSHGVFTLLFENLFCERESGLVARFFFYIFIY